MRFFCNSCRGIVEANDLQAGEEVQCGHCDAVVRVPAGKFAPGSIIGDFSIEREIAKGGMGVVYLARQISLDRPAALKILQQHMVDDPSLVAGLIQEARAAAKLNHPNIVQAYAVGEDDGVFYFAMEFVDGPTMKTVLKEEKILQPKRAAEIIREIADALSFAWAEQKLTHRDIKPDNIIMSSNGRAKLADLGLSRVAGAGDEAEEGEEVLGTPQYISPEQLTGAPVDTRSDIYSLGATFYQFVTGRFPYIGKTAEEITRQHVEGTLEPPREVNKLLPDEINRIIIKMMAKNPEDRYQSPADVAKELEDYIAGRTPAAAGAKASEPALKAGAAPAEPGKLGDGGNSAVNIKAPGAGVKINFKKDSAPAAPKPPPAPAQQDADGDAAAAAVVKSAAGAGENVPVAVAIAAPNGGGKPPVRRAARPGAPAAPGGGNAAPLLKKPAEGKGEPAGEKKPLPMAPPPARSGGGGANKDKIKVIVALVLFFVAGLVAAYHFGAFEKLGALIGGGDQEATSGTSTATTTPTGTPPGPPQGGGVTQPPGPPQNATGPKPSEGEKPAEPPPPQLVVSDYAALGNALLESHGKVPEEEFMTRCDAFFVRFPAPGNAAEARLQERIRPLYAAAEEKLRSADARARLAQAHNTAIQGRRAAAEDQRRAAQAAEEAAAAARRAAEEFDRNQLQESRTYLGHLSADRDELVLAFARSIFAGNSAAWREARRKSFFFNQPMPTHLHKDVAGEVETAYATVKQLDEEIDNALSAVKQVNEYIPRIKGTQFEYGDRRQLVELQSFNKSEFVLGSAFSNETFSVDPADFTPEALVDIASRVDRRTGYPYTLFFAMLARKEIAPWMVPLAPEGYWRNSMQALVSADSAD